MKIIFAFIFSIILIFAFALWSQAGRIIEPIDLICSKKPLIELLWPADKKFCTSGYAVFMYAGKDDFGNKAVEAECLSKEDLKDAEEMYKEFHDWRKDCLRNPDEATMPCFPKSKDPCIGYKE